MGAMDQSKRRARRALWLAIGSSLLLHAALLFITNAPARPPAGPAGTSREQQPRLLATLASPAGATTRQSPPKSAAATRPPAPRQPAARANAPSLATEKPKLSAPTGERAQRSWTAAERADMTKFLDELAAEARPPSGRELSQRALAVARQMRSAEHDNGEDNDTRQVTQGNGVDPYSLELYFEALIRKMNRSAAFVVNDPHRRRGSRKALVEIAINADGTLKDYRVLRSGDQSEEIAYIKSVLDRASPFSAFPRDIRRAGEHISILMCILPARSGGNGGFARSFGDQDCRN